jgi:hypothetical protein
MYVKSTFFAVSLATLVRLRFSPHTLCALCLCGLLGCGGSSSISDRGNAIVIGAADGPVADELATQFNLHPSGTVAGNPAMVLLDGDHISVSTVSSLVGLKEAADRGTPIVVVDGSEELHSAVADEIGALGGIGGNALAASYTKVVDAERPYFLMRLLPGGNKTIRSKKVGVGSDGVIQGSSETTEVPRIADPISMRRFAELVGEKSNAGNPSPPYLPPGMKTFYTAVNLVDGGVEENLSHQRADRNLWFGFLGVMSEFPAGNFKQHLWVTVNGALTTGPLVRNGMEGQNLVFGWLQAQASVNLNIFGSTSRGEQVQAQSWSNLYPTGGKGTQSKDSELIFYRDRNNNLLPWLLTIGQDQPMTDWDGNGEALGASLDYSLKQTLPFDWDRQNFQDSWTPSGIKSFPSETTNSLPISITGNYDFGTVLRGKIKVFYSSKRHFALVGAYLDPTFHLNPIPSSVEEIGDGTASSLLLDMSTIHP